MTIAIDIPATLPTIADLVRQLNAEGIRYCHWKSTHRLHQALSGRTDLDLLVDRRQGRQFRDILARADYKRLNSHPRQQYPGLEDYLGFDPETGNLTHLHVHYHLVLGEQFVKNYSLPLEQVFLENTYMHPSGIKVPVPELEIIVLVLRALLKYRDRDVVRDIARIGRAEGLPSGLLDEFEYLLTQTSLTAIECALDWYMPFISKQLILTFLATIERAPRAGWTLYRLRRSVRRELSAFQRMSRWQARTRYYSSMLGKLWPFDRVVRRLFPNTEKHKTPASDGLAIAFVGSDGAGKSTVIRHISKWLSWRLTVRNYYMGSARPSPGTRVLKRSADLLELGYSACRRLFGAHNPLSRLADRPHRLVDELRFISEGRDRYERYRRGQRAVAQGALVIYDRFPLTMIEVSGRPVDGPRIAARGGGQPGTLSHRLMSIERAIYSRIRPPEHLFLLRVSPDVARLRKPEHPRAMIEAKCQAIDQITREDIASITIDADQPIETVLLQIKTALWSRI